MLKYITFRVFESFDKKNDSFALKKIRTLGFLLLMEVSLFIPLLMVINLFYHLNPKELFDAATFRYAFVIIIAIMHIMNLLFFNNKIKESENYLFLFNRFHKERYLIKTWMIFSIPIINVFIVPIMYGALNGTLRFPFLEN
jgi:hypothetical protein